MGAMFLSNKDRQSWDKAVDYLLPPSRASKAVYGALFVGSMITEPEVNVSKLKNLRIAQAANFFDGSVYTGKVLEQLAHNDFHGFPESVDGFANAGSVSEITGRDGVVRLKLEIPGTYKGRDGVFENIKNPDGTINHRLFVPTGQ
jgi:hypothetical protein